jgi:zinc D-Ala-D-Ala carboxypeptidase
MNIMKQKTPFIFAGLFLVLISIFIFRYVNVQYPPNENNQTADNFEVDVRESTGDEPKVGFDTTLHSLEDPNSIWVIVNKQRPLPAGFVPSDLIVPSVKLRLGPNEEQMQLSRGAQQDLENMFTAAQQEGVVLVFGSGYRSEALQAQFYDSYVARDGQLAADRYSARPGTSEHQTGLAVDITSPSGECHLEVCFENTPQGVWLAGNAYTYGFIIRYLDGKEDITGYQYEPWHLRYVGTELAKELHKNQLTMEEFFEITVN